MRAAFVAGAAATLGLLALASLPPTAEWPRHGVVRAQLFRAPVTAPVVHEPLALAHADNLTRWPRNGRDGAAMTPKQNWLKGFVSFEIALFSQRVAHRIGWRPIAASRSSAAWLAGAPEAGLVLEPENVRWESNERFRCPTSWAWWLSAPVTRKSR